MKKLSVEQANKRYFSTLKLVKFFIGEPKVIGNMPELQTGVFVANHFTALDPAYMAIALYKNQCNVKPAFVAKIELKSLGFVRDLLGIDVYFKDRENPHSNYSVNQMNCAIRKLIKGHPLIVFPTATRLTKVKLEKSAQLDRDNGLVPLKHVTQFDSSVVGLGKFSIKNQTDKGSPIHIFALAKHKNIRYISYVKTVNLLDMGYNLKTDLEEATVYLREETEMGVEKLNKEIKAKTFVKKQIGLGKV